MDFETGSTESELSTMPSETNSPTNSESSLAEKASCQLSRLFAPSSCAFEL
ncbi:MAG: hypothetical protein L6V83_01670 [Christensenella sp.]|nr:MAG: hypothetical protein L6V83_01670 [Christensenella sp.]